MLASGSARNVVTGQLLSLRGGFRRNDVPALVATRLRFSPTA